MINVNKGGNSPYCPKCGTLLPAGSNYCGNCGYKKGSVGFWKVGRVLKKVNWTFWAAYVARALDVATNWIESTTKKGVAKLFGESYSAPNFAIFNALALIFCNVPAGAVGLFYSWRVYSLKQANDYSGARRASKSAKIWFFVALFLLFVLRLPLALLHR